MRNRSSDISLIVFDYDGTLISNNSFRFYIFYLFVVSFILFRVKSLSFLFALIKKKVRGSIDHVDFKFEIDLIGSSFASIFNSFFCALISRAFRRRSVVEKLKSYLSQGRRVIISTAAPYCYAQHLETVFQGIEFVSSYSDFTMRDKKTDNTGSFKIISIMGHLGTERIEIDTVFTDHEADYALLEIAKRRVVVRPDAKSLAYFRTHLRDFELM